MKISDKAIKNLCSSTIYSRGLEYFKQGRVHITKRENNAITANVDGDYLYTVRVSVDDNKITDYFCTCPYYETMLVPCKHIVAALKEYESEQNCLSDESKETAGKRIGHELCLEYSHQPSERKKLDIHFTLRINSQSIYLSSFDMIFYINNKRVKEPDKLFEAILLKGTYDIDKKTKYHPWENCFDEASEKILSILSNDKWEILLNNFSCKNYLNFAPIRAGLMKSILEVLQETDYDIEFNGNNVGKMLILNENPDVLIDISAMLSEITLFVANYGIALIPDGSIFYYENAIYLTDSSWQKVFLPIYRLLAEEKRSQITFQGEDSLLFATTALQKLKDAPGVVTDYLNDAIIKEKPKFSIYVHTNANSVICKIIVNYGKFSFEIPNSSPPKECIIIRDYEAENDILSNFDYFVYIQNYFRLYDNDNIYDFIFIRLKELKKIANVIESEDFTEMAQESALPIKTKISYNPSVHLLQAEPKTSLSLDEIIKILRSVKLNKNFYRNENVSLINIKKSKKEIYDFINLFYNDEKIDLSKKEVPEHNLLYYAAMSQMKNKSINVDSSVTNYVNSIKEIKAIIPDNLKKILRDYQKTGINWMKQLSSLGLGGILADDMGLGKTLQTIAYLVGENPKEPILIITPSALTYNWLHEFTKFSPQSKVIIIDGTKEERIEKTDKIHDFQFVIVSYPLLRRDIDIFEKISFSYCIIDEAQAIKNYKTMNATSVKRIKAKNRFALTGTPIENSIKELWSIFDFIIPGYLSNYKDFKDNYENPIIQNSDEIALEELKVRIKPFVLRRMKKDVLLELPDKFEQVIYAKMTDEQEKMYKSYHAIAKNKTLAMLEDNGNNTIEFLTLLLRLRQICCHPKLFDISYKKESGKLMLLENLIETAVSSGHRILVFSQFTTMLSIISESLKKMNISYFYIDGNTPSKRRIDLSDRFNNGECNLFLISLKAGGTGLNLIGADTVIHYDPWWNPAVTDQASDRAYRIGQTKDVQVIRLACENTIEAKILELQERKRNLADDIININNKTLSSLTTEDIIYLFEN